MTIRVLLVDDHAIVRDGLRFLLEAHRDFDVVGGVANGHDAVRAELCWRRGEEETARRVAMKPLGNDRFGAEFAVDQLGRCAYAVEAWVDHLLSWRLELARRIDFQEVLFADRREAVHRADAVDVAGDQMPAEPVGQA